MLEMFGIGMSDEIIRLVVGQKPRRDQDAIFQGLYNKGYSGKDISKFFGMSESALYSRIDAHRGRGPSPKPQ